MSALFGTISPHGAMLTTTVDELFETLPAPSMDANRLGKE